MYNNVVMVGLILCVEVYKFAICIYNIFLERTT